jgi:hypothetical protein
MAITYTSKYHSPEDPGGAIQEALAMGDAFPGPARDIVLAWMLRLDGSVAPHAAARRLLDRHDLAEGPLPDGPRGELVRLLREAAQATEESLKARGRARRAARRGRPARD